MTPTSSLDPVTEADAWRAELLAINLSRLRWMWIVVTVLAVGFLATTLFVRELSSVWTRRAAVDVVFAVTFLLASRPARRARSGSPWPMRYLWVSVALMLGGMDIYYFETLAAFGQYSDYVIGLVIVAAIVLAPPRALVSVLWANHAVFVIALLRTDVPHMVIIASLIDNTVAVVIASFVAGILYRSRYAEFARARALAAVNADLREVMAIAAHDLRSPLLGLRDLVELARKDRAGTATDPRVLDLVADTCAGLIRLVSRLVDAHAADEGVISIALDAHDLRLACTDAAQRVRATAAAKEQHIELAVPQQPALARLDATAFAEVLDNLISNALKFSPRGTTVECELFGRDGMWCVEVRDEGPSVPIDERGRLFQKFHRGSARPTGGEASTGLGLFIVRRLTEAMGGRVAHAPRLPRGSVFSIELPQLAVVSSSARDTASGRAPYSQTY
jgi:signal transduction histidine kinase